MCAAKNQIDAATVKGFVFKTYKAETSACFQVISGGKVVFRHTDEGLLRFFLGQPGDPSVNLPAVSNGTDVTGRGHPDMIVWVFTGGAHCCFTHYVFELEPEFRLLATLDDAHDDHAHFARDVKDRRYYYHTADWTFAYWPTCFACSPAEAVVLRWVDDTNGGRFHLALDKMKKPAPTPAQWNKDISAAHKVVNQGDMTSIGRTLWQTVLDLIYTGHSDLAWKFVEEAGPRAQQKPFPSLTDFCSLFKQSQYWPDLAPTFQNPPPACTSAKPAGTK